MLFVLLLVVVVVVVVAVGRPEQSFFRSVIFVLVVVLRISVSVVLDVASDTKPLILTEYNMVKKRTYSSAFVHWVPGLRAGLSPLKNITVTTSS
jgi:hypothetical protein